MFTMYIRVHAVPEAKREVITKEADGVYQISVREPAERNLANSRIRELLAAELGISGRAVRLISGHHGPTKLFSILDTE